MSTEHAERFTFGKENINMDDLAGDKDSGKKVSDYSDTTFEIPEYDANCKEGRREKIINDFVANSTTHGVPRVLNSSRPSLSRLFWLVVTLVLIGGLLYQGSKLVIRFFDRPTTTKISLVTRSRLEFPAVTICNLNMMRRSKLKGTRFQGLADLDKDHQVSGIGLETGDYDWFFDESLPTSDPSSASPDTTTPPSRSRNGRAINPDYSYHDEYDYDEFNSIGDPNDWEAFYSRSVASDFSDLRAVVRPTVDELREYGHQAKDFILQCTFDTVPCSFRNFTVIQNARYGNCFVFNNAHKLRRRKRGTTTTKTGSQYGLHLTLLVEQPEYVGILSPDSGVTVVIHDPKIYAFPEDDGIDVAPGFATSIAVTKTNIIRLPDPHGDCTHNHAPHYQPEKYDFSQRSCFKLCLQKNLKQRCACVTDILINGTKCGAIDQEQVKCRSGVIRDFLRNRLKCSCSNPCNETVFNPRISTTRWPAARYEAHLYDRLANVSRKAARLLTNTRQSRNNLVRLRVFYEQLNFEEVEETPLITVEGLFGGVGGLLGLYVGVSFISLMEIIVFILELLRSLCCPKTYSSKKTKVSDH